MKLTSNVVMGASSGWGSLPQGVWSLPSNAGKPLTQGQLLGAALCSLMSLSWVDAHSFTEGRLLRAMLSECVQGYCGAPQPYSGRHIQSPTAVSPSLFNECVGDEIISNVTSFPMGTGGAYTLQTSCEPESLSRRLEAGRTGPNLSYFMAL